MYLVMKGTISIRKMKGASYIELARVYTNEIIGELSFFDRQPRSASAFALTEVEVTEIPFDVLEKAFQATPAYMRAMIAGLADRLRKADESIKRLQKNATGPMGTTDEAESESETFDTASVIEAANIAFDGDPNKDPADDGSGTR
jgi:CRP-like cAMP-binding protein